MKLSATGCYPLQKSWLASVASLLQLPPKAHLENGRQNSAQCHRVGEYPAFHQYVQADLGKGTPTHWQRCFHPKWVIHAYALYITFIVILYMYNLYSHIKIEIIANLSKELSDASNCPA